MWGHRHPHMLKAGRITHAEPVGMSEEEKEEYMGKLNESDPIVDTYRALNEDQPMPGLETAWLTKVVGDQ